MIKVVYFDEGSATDFIYVLAVTFSVSGGYDTFRCHACVQLIKLLLI